MHASHAARWLGAEADGTGRVMVEADLRVKGHNNIFVIGDTAHVKGPEGRALPGVATVAKQQGYYVARWLMRKADGESSPPFRYRDPGVMGTIGRNRAIAEIGRLKFSGFPAWLLWSLVHIYFLIGFRSRLVVALSWAWSYLTFDRGARLITGDDGVTAALQQQARSYRRATRPDRSSSQHAPHPIAKSYQNRSEAAFPGAAAEVGCSPGSRPPSGHPGVAP